MGQWKRILKFGPLVPVSPSQKVSHLVLLHRAYYTPKKLYMFGRRPDDRCPRCRETGDLIHMVWRCPKLFRYWTEILKIINATFRVTLELEPRVCVLGHIEEEIGTIGTIPVIARCLYQARKSIAQSWQSMKPPTPEEWVMTINMLVWKEKVTFTRRGNYSKFVKLWKPWLQRMECPL